MVIKPLSMPTASLSTLATGARQLVVQEALETTVCALVELVVVDAIDDGEIDAVGRRRDQDALGAGLQMRRGLVLRGENAGAFQRDVDAELLPRQLRRVLHRGDFDGAVAAG